MHLSVECLSVIFFFSSRRRHTRWNCDWSSDVCSSDLSTRGRICGSRRTFCTRYRRTRRRGRGEGGRQKAEGIHHRGTEGTEAGREEGGTRCFRRSETDPLRRRETDPQGDMILDRDRRTDKPPSVHPTLPSLRWIECSRPARGRVMHRPRRAGAERAWPSLSRYRYPRLRAARYVRVVLTVAWAVVPGARSHAIRRVIRCVVWE